MGVDGVVYGEPVGDDAIDGLGLERIEQWQRAFQERATQARVLATRTSGLSATAREGDGIVEVLGEEIRDQPAAATARQILSAIRSAKASLAHEFAQATADTVGLESATGRALIDSSNARLGLSDGPDDSRAGIPHDE
jgi:hypothetical protein